MFPLFGLINQEMFIFYGDLILFFVLNFMFKFIN
jgi:hypothetical protein